MDKLTFTSQVIAAIAWPVCVLSIAVLFKRQITELLGRITNGKIPGGEFEFSEAAKRELAEAKQPAGHDVGSANTSSALDAAYRLLDILPGAAMIEAWRALYESALGHLTEPDDSSYSGVDYPTRRPPPAKLGELLRAEGDLSEDQMAVFDELRQLRMTQLSTLMQL